MSITDRIYCILADKTPQLKQLTDIVGKPSSSIKLKEPIIIEPDISTDDELIYETSIPRYITPYEEYL
jgi:hypothetical protein